MNFSIKKFDFKFNLIYCGGWVGLGWEEGLLDISESTYLVKDLTGNFPLDKKRFGQILE